MTVIGLVHGTIETPVLVLLFRLVGLTFLSGFIAGSAAFLFRWRAGIQLPEGPALLLGLGSVAVYLNTRIALVQFLGTDGGVLTRSSIATNLLILIAATFTANAGWRIGDRIGAEEQAKNRFRPDFSPFVRATGRMITVEIPAEIDDISGYDPVTEETKEQLAGDTYSFSRGLTVERLEAALTTRLRTDYDIAHVDVELSVDGTVDYLAVGRRASGIGPALPPGMSATAINADPAFSASPGDTVQIWNGSTGDRVGNAELRATAGQTVTVIARTDVIDSLDPRTSYRLMTLAVDERIDRVFMGMLRRADETMGVTEITEGATLVGMTVGELGLSVMAITDSEGTTETIPSRDREFVAGDSIFVIAHPTNLRRVEAAATGTASYEQSTTKPDRKEGGDSGSRLRFWNRRKTT
jgi:hypothetical protein